MSRDECMEHVYSVMQKKYTVDFYLEFYKDTNTVVLKVTALGFCHTCEIEPYDLDLERIENICNNAVKKLEQYIVKSLYK